MNSNLQKTKNNFIFCDLRIIVVIGIFHISSILFVSSAARKFTLQTRLLRILLTLFSQHYCLKCVYSELAKFLPSTYFQASDFKRNKKIGTKVEHVNEWNMGTEIFEIQCRSTWRYHHRLMKKSGWLTLEWKLFFDNSIIISKPYFLGER